MVRSLTISAIVLSPSKESLTGKCMDRIRRMFALGKDQQLGQAAAVYAGLSQATNCIDHVDGLPGSGYVMDAKHPSTQPGGDRRGGQGAGEAVYRHWYVECFANKVLARQGHQHRPAGVYHLIKPSRDL